MSRSQCQHNGIHCLCTPAASPWRLPVFASSGPYTHQHSRLAKDAQQSSALGHSRGQARLKHTTTVPFHSLLHDTLPTSSLSVLLISMSSTPVLCTSRRREREREERRGVEREVRGREREGRREGGRGRQEGRRRLVERVTTAHNSLASLEVTEPGWPQHHYTKGAPPLCPQPASTHPPSPKLPTVRPTICVPV